MVSTLPTLSITDTLALPPSERFATLCRALPCVPYWTSTYLVQRCWRLLAEPDVYDNQLKANPSPFTKTSSAQSDASYAFSHAHDFVVPPKFTLDNAAAYRTALSVFLQMHTTALTRVMSVAPFYPGALIKNQLNPLNHPPVSGIRHDWARYLDQQFHFLRWKPIGASPADIATLLEVCQTCSEYPLPQLFNTPTGSFAHNTPIFKELFSPLQNKPRKHLTLEEEAQGILTRLGHYRYTAELNPMYLTTTTLPLIDILKETLQSDRPAKELPHEEYQKFLRYLAESMQNYASKTFNGPYAQTLEDFPTEALHYFTQKLPSQNGTYTITVSELCVLFAGSWVSEIHFEPEKLPSLFLDFYFHRSSTAPFQPKAKFELFELFNAFFTPVNEHLSKLPEYSHFNRLFQGPSATKMGAPFINDPTSEGRLFSSSPLGLDAEVIMEISELPLYDSPAPTPISLSVYDAMYHSHYSSLAPDERYDTLRAHFLLFTDKLSDPKACLDFNWLSVTAPLDRVVLPSFNGQFHTCSMFVNVPKEQSTFESADTIYQSISKIVSNLPVDALTQVCTYDSYPYPEALPAHFTSNKVLDQALIPHFITGYSEKIEASYLKSQVNLNREATSKSLDSQNSGTHQETAPLLSNTQPKKLRV